MVKTEGLDSFYNFGLTGQIRLVALIGSINEVIAICLRPAVSTLQVHRLQKRGRPQRV
jgi:hypothetical protein